MGEEGSVTAAEGLRWSWGLGKLGMEVGAPDRRRGGVGTGRAVCSPGTGPPRGTADCRGCVEVGPCVFILAGVGA
jgi:hypothetical protein